MDNTGQQNPVCLLFFNVKVGSDTGCTPNVGPYASKYSQSSKKSKIDKIMSEPNWMNLKMSTVRFEPRILCFVDQRVNH